MIKTSCKSFFIIILFLGILIPTENDLDEYFDLYQKIFETFTKNYVDTLDKTELIKLSFDGMFKEVDP